MLSPRRSWWAAAGAFGLLCSGAYAFVVYTDRIATEARLEQEVSATARLMRTHAADAIVNGGDTLRVAAEAVAELVGGAADARSVQRRLNDLVVANPALGTLWAVDTDGFTLVNNLEPTPRRERTERDYFLAHIAGGGGLFIGKADIGTLVPRPRFTLSLPIRNANGELSAVVAAGVDSKYFEDIFAAIRPSIGVEATLFKLTGEQLATWPGSAPAPSGDLVMQSVQEKSEDGLLIKDGTGLTAISRIPNFPIAVVVRADGRMALTGWRERAQYTAVPVLLSFLAFASLTVLGLRGVAANEAARAELETRVAERTEQLQLLLGELNHRVKNNLQLVSSLVQAGLSSIKDPAIMTAMRDTAHRIAALAEVHRTLEEAPTSGVHAEDYLTTIVKRLSEALVGAGQTIDVRVEAPNVELATDHAVALGIAVNELVTNAFKHAFHDRTTGAVHVRLASDGNKHVLTVADDGAGSASLEEAAPSTGSRILHAMILRLGGDLHVTSGATGTVATLTFPMTRPPVHQVAAVRSS